MLIWTTIWVEGLFSSKDEPRLCMRSTDAMAGIYNMHNDFSKYPTDKPKILLSPGPTYFEKGKNITFPNVTWPVFLQPLSRGLEYAVNLHIPELLWKTDSCQLSVLKREILVCTNAKRQMIWGKTQLWHFSVFWSCHDSHQILLLSSMLQKNKTFQSHVKLLVTPNQKSCG